MSPEAQAQMSQAVGDLVREGASPMVHVLHWLADQSGRNVEMVLTVSPGNENVGINLTLHPLEPKQ